MQSVIEQEPFERYDMPIVYRMRTIFQTADQYIVHDEPAVGRARQSDEADLNVFAELEELEHTDPFSLPTTLYDICLRQQAPLVPAPPANRNHAGELLAVLPEETHLLSGTLTRLKDAVTTRRSLRSKRIRRLTREISDLRKVLGPFAEMPSGYTSTQLGLGGQS